jgi:glutamine phosphoribosylpyrophosphate amidotransferase
VAVVQNGIIENYRSLREELQGQGVVFKSETDTEVIPHLVGRQLAQLLAEGRKPSGALLLGALAAWGLCAGGGMGQNAWGSGGGAQSCPAADRFGGG